MTINYIILAHKEPHQLHRLVERLTTPHTFFYVHVDRNSAIAPFENALKNKHNVTLLSQQKRVASAWGSPGLVIATLQAMREIAGDQRNGYTILLSGQCYPIKSNDYIASFLKENQGYNFMEGFDLPDARWGSSDTRMKRYTFFLSAKKGDLISLPAFFDQPASSLLNSAAIRKYLKVMLYCPLKTWVLFRKRRFPPYLKPYGGMQWWALPNETVAFILRYVADNPAYLKYHAYTLFSDEVFFQTLVYNFFDKIKNPVTFSSWSGTDICSSPQTFTSEHIGILKERQELFARKFDYDVDRKVLDVIDQHLL